MLNEFIYKTQKSDKHCKAEQSSFSKLIWLLNLMNEFIEQSLIENKTVFFAPPFTSSTSIPYSCSALQTISNNTGKVFLKHYSQLVFLSNCCIFYILIIANIHYKPQFSVKHLYYITYLIYQTNINICDLL